MEGMPVEMEGAHHITQTHSMLMPHRQAACKHGPQLPLKHPSTHRVVTGATGRAGAAMGRAAGGGREGGVAGESGKAVVGQAG